MQPSQANATSPSTPKAATAFLNKITDDLAHNAQEKAHREVEADSEAWRQGMLPCHSRTRMAWDMIGLVSVFAQAGMLLLASILTFRCKQDVLCNADDDGSFIAALRQTAAQAEWAGSIFFTLDMIVNLRTTYCEADGTEVVDPGLCAHRYATTWLGFDLICVLPLGLILDAPVDMVNDELTGMRRVLQKYSRVKAWWGKARGWKSIKITKNLVKAPKIIKKQRHNIAAVRSSVGVGRALRVFRLLSRLKVIKVIVVVIKESKFIIKFLKRISTSERVSYHTRSNSRGPRACAPVARRRGLYRAHPNTIASFSHRDRRCAWPSQW